jgi:hypothetical protein
VEEGFVDEAEADGGFQVARLQRIENDRIVWPDRFEMVGSEKNDHSILN